MKYTVKSDSRVDDFQLEVEIIADSLDEAIEIFYDGYADERFFEIVSIT